MISIMVYSASFMFSWGPICWVLIAEVFPNTIRGQAVAIAVAFQWIFNWIVSTSFVPMSNSLGFWFTYGLYGVICIIAALFVWRLVPETKGKTLEDMMESDMKNLEKYMEDFVDLQLQVQSKKSPLLKGMKDKLARQINGLKDLDATTRYELLTRLESMPKHNKVCHGDFNPSNVIVGKNGKMTVVDWAHATQGNASADAAMTYLLFALKDQKVADLYLKLFCKKSDTAMQYVQQWLPIVAAAQLSKENELEKDFLMRWIDVVDYQ